MKRKHSFWPVFENTLPWVSLVLIVFFNYSYFVVLPFSGFYVNLSAQRWKVGDVNPSSPLQVGDILTRVGAVSADEASRDLNVGFFNNVHNGDTLEIELLRNGQPLTLTYTLPEVSPEDFWEEINSPWLIPYIFWLAGCAALLFLRPRELLRRIFMLFCFLTAAWISTGAISGQHFMGAALALRFLVWLSVPVYLHLHWLFPTPLGKLPGWVWGVLYGLSALLAVASLFQLLPQNLYMFGFILAILGSLILLVVHVIKQPAERRPLAGMVIALGIALVPVIVISALFIIKFEIIYAQIIILGLVALPGFYFFTLYIRQQTSEQARQSQRLLRVYFFLIIGGLIFCLAFSWYVDGYISATNYADRTLVVPLILSVIALLSFVPFLVLPALGDERITLHLGQSTFGFSANRAAPAAIFLLLQALAGLSVYVLIRTQAFPGAEALAILATVLVIGLLGLLGFAPFQRFFERRVLGMPLAPEALLKTYAARITTSLELESLRALLLNEVLPSLLVRQFAQLEWRGETLTPLFALRVADAELPAPHSQPAVEQAAGAFWPPSAPSSLPAWVRVALPLRAAGQLRGYWLLGQRDPDDRYAPDEIATLQALADQTALALVNIEQAALLRALYFEDIERHEAERLHLAAELHDDVLNQLAALNLTLPGASPATAAAYDQAVLRIREIINGLRPAMLNYGLLPALESLVDELNDRLPQGPRLLLEVPLPESALRYPARVELALFRVTQQACSNAIQHAGCQTIRIQGRLDEGCAALAVVDDGQGFDVPLAADLPALLVAGHFGLAGMHERAALIGASLRFTSTPAQGTRVDIYWQG